MVAPFALFYLFLVVAGFRGALIAGLAWSYLALGRRLVRHQRPPATVVLGSVVLTARTAISFVTGSAFVYFVQPTVGTAAVALAFLATALARRPLVERLARDFCPIDPSVMARPAVRRFFLQVSVLWGGVLLANAGVVLWLLLSTSVRTFIVERTVTTWSLTTMAVVVSTLWFVRAMRQEGLRVRWGGGKVAGPEDSLVTPS